MLTKILPYGAKLYEHTLNSLFLFLLKLLYSHNTRNALIIKIMTQNNNKGLISYLLKEEDNRLFPSPIFIRSNTCK